MPEVRVVNDACQTLSLTRGPFDGLQSRYSLSEDKKLVESADRPTHTGPAEGTYPAHHDKIVDLKRVHAVKL